MSNPCARCGHDASEHTTEEAIGGEGKRELCMLCPGYFVTIGSGDFEYEVPGYDYNGKAWHRFQAETKIGS